jgi:hypothetical protein
MCNLHLDPCAAHYMFGGRRWRQALIARVSCHEDYFVIAIQRGIWIRSRKVTRASHRFSHHDEVGGKPPATQTIACYCRFAWS